MGIRTSCIAMGVSLALAGPAVAATVTFDLEGTAVTSGGALTTLSQTQSGLTLTFTRPGSNFDIQNLSASAGPPSFGTRTLSPFNDTGNTGFIVNFSQALSQFGFSSGDYNADADTTTLQLFSGAGGTGTLLASQTISRTAAATFPGDVDVFSLSALGALSARFIGGSTTFPNSVFYDNFTATFGTAAVPEPSGIALLGAGVLALAVRRRRKAG